MTEHKQVFSVEIPVPDNLVILEKDEYLRLIRENDVGMWWTLDDVMERLKIGRKKLVNQILLNPRFKEEMDIEINPQGFVAYPTSKGSPYMFLASRAKRYFEEHFGELLLS